MQIYTIAVQTEEPLGAATRECVLQLRGVTTTKARVVAWGISFDGVTSAAEPVLVHLERQSTDGTATAATEEALDPDDAAAVVTGFRTFTAQPTSSNILEVYNIHPMGGGLVREYPPGREPVLDNATSSRIGITVTAPAAVNAVAWLMWEE
jgi:hypothetical protein